VFQPPAVKAAEPAAEPAAPVAVARPVPTPVLTKTDGDQNAEKDAADAAAAAELAKLKSNAGLDTVPAAKEPPVAVKDRLAPVDTGSLGRAANAGVAAAAPATTSDPTEFIRDKSDDKFDRPEKKKTQNKEPAVNAGIRISPTVFSYATQLGLIQNGKIDVERIRKFQRSNGLKDDGIIGADTSGAIISAIQPNMRPNRDSNVDSTGRDAISRQRFPANTPAATSTPQNALPVPSATPAAPPPKPVIGEPMPNGRRASQADVLSWENQYGPGAQAAKQKDAASAAAAAAAKKAYNPFVQNKVQEDISRMKFLAGLAKD